MDACVGQKDHRVDFVLGSSWFNSRPAWFWGPLCNGFSISGPLLTFKDKWGEKSSKVSVIIIINVGSIFEKLFCCGALHFTHKRTEPKNQKFTVFSVT